MTREEDTMGARVRVSPDRWSFELRHRLAVSMCVLLLLLLLFCPACVQRRRRKKRSYYWEGRERWIIIGVYIYIWKRRVSKNNKDRTSRLREGLVYLPLSISISISVSLSRRRLRRGTTTTTTEFPRPIGGRRVTGYISFKARK